MADTGSEMLLVNDSCSPGERRGAVIVAGEEGIDLVSDLFGGGEADAMQGASAEDGEPISTWFNQEAWAMGPERSIGCL